MQASFVAQVRRRSPPVRPASTALLPHPHRHYALLDPGVLRRRLPLFRVASATTPPISAKALRPHAPHAPFVALGGMRWYRVCQAGIVFARRAATSQHIPFIWGLLHRVLGCATMHTVGVRVTRVWLGSGANMAL